MTAAAPPEKRKRASRKGGSAPTVADVAQAAGVSPMTVSRVINRHPSVQPETRDRVSRAIAELGYVPNPAARSLAGRQPCRIALLHSNPSAAYLSEFLVGSLDGAARCDAQLVVEPWNGEERPEQLIGRLAGHRIDAVLLPPPLCDDGPLIAAIAAARLPMAQIATGRPAPQAHAVTISDEAAAHAMTSRLVALGHRRIAFITGASNQTASALRLAGYRRALCEAGIAPADELVARGDFTFRTGMEAGEALLALDPRPTAIFASNDDMAAAVISAAHRRQLDIPGDLSVCGFDDTAMARTVWPEITTIRQPVAEMARQATSLLAETVRARPGEPHPPVHIGLDFALVARESDGPPAG